MQWFCPDCERVVPVFNNLQNYASPTPRANSSDSSGRRLLQNPQQPPPAGVISGTYSVMLVYRQNTTNQTISLADVQRAVYSADTGMSWDLTVDPASLSKFVDALQNNQFIIGTLQVVQSPTASK